VHEPRHTRTAAGLICTGGEANPGSGGAAGGTRLPWRGDELPESTEDAIEARGAEVVPALIGLLSASSGRRRSDGTGGEGGATCAAPCRRPPRL